MSTLRKLDMLANFFDRAHANTLKNNGTFREKYGFHWSVVPELIKAHPLYSFFIVITAILGVIVKFTSFLELFKSV